MDKEFKYDAFISYRHCELDKYVAENLHKVLETYELPKNIKEKLGITGRTIKRVFRDQDELPLSSNLEDPIIDALNNSKYLIVICSPRLKDSLWCKKEIETFKKIRGRKNIFCVLIEGEPEDSFPEEVTYDLIETTDKNGKKKTTKKLVEPLAADVRGETKKEVLQKIKEEKLRLIAPMYNLDYDDLKQRHRQRKMKKIIYTSVIASCVFFLFALYSTVMLLKISSQQKTLKLHQALSLADESNKHLDNDSRYNAVKSSYSSLTKFKGVKMPYTPEAEYALVESLGVYNAGVSYKAMDEAKTKGVIDYIKTSYNDKYALTIDESEEITLWNIDEMKKIKSYHDINTFLATDEHFTFVGEDKFAYISKDGNLKIGLIKNGKIIKEIKKDEYSFKSVNSDINGKYIAINDSPLLRLYNAVNYELVGTYKTVDKVDIEPEIRFTLDGKYLVSVTSVENYDPSKPGKSVIHIFSTDNLKEKDSFDADCEYFEGMIEKDNNIYLLTNQTYGLLSSYVNVISYDIKNNKVNWTEKINDAFAKYIARSYYKDANNLAVVHGNVVDILNMSNGETIRRYALQSDVVGIFSSTSANTYIAFTTNGSVNFIDLNQKENLVVPGLFELNLDKYNYATKNNKGYLLVPKYENRIILYEQNQSKKIKEIDEKIDYPKNSDVNISDVDKIKKEYNLKKKNLVKRMIYADKKKLLIVSYTDNTASIYRVKDKKYLAMINNVDEIEYYHGKDKENRMYVGNISNTYIIDKDYNNVGHIKSMIKLDSKNNRVIISRSGKYYSLPIYSLDDLLSEAKSYLNK